MMNNFNKKTSKSGNFNTTHWSVILAAGSEDSVVAQRGLQELCQLYWYPLYAFARKQGENVNDAQDMVQGFFEVFLSKKYIDDIDSSKGRFRSFLLRSMKHFMSNQWKKSRAQKRGGKLNPVSFDCEVAESRYSLENGHNLSPDVLFDRCWILTLLDSVLDRLKEQYKVDGRENVFECLKDSLVQRKSDISRAEQAKDLGITEAAVKVAVHRLRQRYQKIFKEMVSETLQNDADIESEMKELLKILKM